MLYTLDLINLSVRSVKSHSLNLFICMYTIISFYKFAPLLKFDLEKIKIDLVNCFSDVSKYGGLTLISPEGINTTVSFNMISSTGENISEESLALEISKLVTFYSTFFNTESVIIKKSISEKPPFKRFKVDIRNEIITLTGSHFTEEEIFKADNNESQLSPTEWDEVLSTDDNIVLLDARNNYESRVGKFKNALTPDIRTFTELPKYLESAEISKDKKILMYCTGGVRCDKAYVELKKSGYENLYQLKGGILKYIEEFPNRHYEGECFVFDNRIALQQEDLTPTNQYSLCPHCGDPGSISIKCVHCMKDAVLCEECNSKKGICVCSKNCRHHFQRQEIKKMSMKEEVGESQSL